MRSRVPLGIAIPQIFQDEPVGPGGIRDFLLRAESLGYESGWVQEQILGSAKTYEPIELLTFAAACTTRLRLGSAVLLTALRSPVHTAKSLATLDHLSQGRLIVGVGLGAAQKLYPAFGMTAMRRAARFTEGLRLMIRLWTEPRVTFDGEFYKLDHVAMEPKPNQKPHPPLWFGAHHPDALKRAVDLGQGFIGAGSSPTPVFKDEVSVVRKLLEAARRDPTSFPITKRVYIAVDKDKARAGRRLTEWFAAYYRRGEMAEQVSVWGGAEECAEGLRAIITAGAQSLLLNPVFDHMEHVEVLAHEVAPRL